jgi:hypothetical protein
MTSKPLQEDIDDREVEFGSFELFQSRGGARGLGDLEMVDPQHDADHRAHVGLVVNHKNAGHGGLPIRFRSIKGGYSGQPYFRFPDRLRHMQPLAEACGTAKQRSS